MNIHTVNTRFRDLVMVIGPDTVLKLGGTDSEIFFSVPPKFALCPPIPGAQRGHTTVENRHCENNTSFKKTRHC